MENLESMNRKEWKLYAKEMKKLEKRNKEAHESITTEELKDLTAYYRESTRRLNIQTDRNYKIAFVFGIVAIFFQIVALVFGVMNHFKKKDNAEKIAETTAPKAEATAAISANTDIFFESLTDFSEDSAACFVSSLEA